MSKYHQNALRNMAQVVVEHMLINDLKYAYFIERLSAETGLSKIQCQQEILRLAGYL